MPASASVSISSGSPPSPAAVLQLHPADNVIVALTRLPAGRQVQWHPPTEPSCDNTSQAVSELTCVESIPAGHKVAARAIEAGEAVIKFGNPIGIATTRIEIGEHVHSQNLVDVHARSETAATASTIAAMDRRVGVAPPHSPLAPLRRTFEGFDRGDGRVGTRNYVLVMSRVNCSATVCHHVAARFPPARLAEFPHVDGIAIATHTTGCALQYASAKHQSLGRVLRGYASHANVGGCLIIGLGCEQTTPEYLREHHRLVQIGEASPATADPWMPDVAVPMLTMQGEGGTTATIDRAEQQLERLLEQANQARRTTVDARHLRVALECGGSDGHSGLTANPAVGVVADCVIACGGAAVLSETTELYGAEHLLVARSRNEAVAGRLLEKIQWWKDHVAMFGGELDNNPSIGNKAGGLTTITEKSLGAVAKSGSTPLEAVVDYAEPVPPSGLTVMDSPGFDPSSVTGKVAGGCNVVLFTTGRGSCFGGKPVPVIKIASHSLLFESMREDMDLDAGVILHGGALQDVGDSFFERLLAVASGEKTCSERLGLGDHEFVPWTVGPVL